jgi:uncharacterized membrane protein
MKPLFVLVVVFMIALLALRAMRGDYQFALAGRIAMAAMLLFTSIAHFAFTKGMSMMLPDIIPYKTEAIYLTGIIEIVIAIGLLVPGFTVPAAWFLIVFFILLLPANIYAAVRHIDYEKATFAGNGPGYLWFRIPLQVLFIVWTYLSAIKL